MRKVNFIIVIVAIIAITATSFVSYNIGHDIGHDIGYDAGHDAGYDIGHDDGYNIGYDMATRKGENEKIDAHHATQQIINEYNILCTEYATSVNSYLETMSEGPHTYDPQIFSEMRKEFDSLRKKAGRKYSQIHQGIVHNEPDYVCINAKQFNDMNLMWDYSAPEFYIEIDPDTRFGDDFTDIYYSENEIGVHVWRGLLVLWTINLDYHDQGPLYSPDTGEGNDYSHLVYTISDPNQSAVLFIYDYNYSQIHYKIVVIDD